jgi:hypothetical protein
MRRGTGTTRLWHARSRFTTYIVSRAYNLAPAFRSFIETMKVARTTLLAGALTLPNLGAEK